LGEKQTLAAAHHLPDRSPPLIEGSVGDALRRAAARFPERPALAWAEGEEVVRLSYAALLAEAERVACWLLERAQPGDRIAIWSRNSVEWVLAEYGCALAGLTIAAWNPAWTDYECEHARDLTTPALVLAGFDTRGVPLIERAQALAPADKVFPLEELRSLVADTASRALPAPSASDLFLIQFTSGTTGRSKGAALSNRSVLNSGGLRAWAAGADETDVWVNPIPMNHVGGAVSMVLSALVSGSCYVVMNRFEAGEQLRMLRQCGGTRTGGVPTMMLALLEHPDWTPGEIAMRTIGSGGTQVPRSLIERLMAAFDAPLLSVYGQSECPMISLTTPKDDAATLAETVGRPAPHTELKICDLTKGRTLEIGEVGEICVRSPYMMEGYFHAPEATAATIDADGFLHTGDLGSLDERGYLRIQGRAREVIIRGGENIYPAEVEDALLGHPDVLSIAVVGVPDERWGQQVGAAVILREGAAPSTAALEAFAATRLAHFKAPRRWIFVEAFPLTPSGKVKKVVVEKMFLEAR
jgi:fatty-acyl-CoA synthase